MFSRRFFWYKIVSYHRTMDFLIIPYQILVLRTLRATVLINPLCNERDSFEFKFLDV